MARTRVVPHCRTRAEWLTSPRQWPIMIKPPEVPKEIGFRLNGRLELRPSPNWRGPLNDHCPKTYLLRTNRYEGAVTKKKLNKNIHPNILKDELRRLRWSQVINHYVQF